MTLDSGCHCNRRSFLSFPLPEMSAAKLKEKRPVPPAIARPTPGLVELFTGNGKGKTTAALGIALRALGHGLRVHIVFFMKGEFPYGEQTSLACLPGLSFERFGSLEFVDPLHVKDEEKAQARLALEASRRAVRSGQYDVVVLDEVLVASAWGLAPVEEVVQLVKEKPERLDLVLTGRYADERLVELADLVTEMKEVKHPFHKGVLSRQGIDY